MMPNTGNDCGRARRFRLRRVGGASAKRRRQRGGVLVEFVIAAPLILGLIFILLDMSLALWAQMTLQYAVREGSRYAVVDHGAIDNNPSCSDVIQVIDRSSMGLTKILAHQYEVQVNDGPSRKIDLSSGCPGTMFGGRGDLTVLTLTAKWPVVTPMLSALVHGPVYEIRVSATMQNEEH